LVYLLVLSLSFFDVLSLDLSNEACSISISELLEIISSSLKESVMEIVDDFFFPQENLFSFFLRLVGLSWRGVSWVAQLSRISNILAV